MVGVAAGVACVGLNWTGRGTKGCLRCKRALRLSQGERGGSGLYWYKRGQGPRVIGARTGIYQSIEQRNGQLN